MISSDFIFKFIEFPNEFLHSGYIFVYFFFFLCGHRGALSGENAVGIFFKKKMYIIIKFKN